MRNSSPTILPIGETNPANKSEEVLNAQSENSLAQNKVLTSMKQSVAEVQSKIDRVETQIDTTNTQVSHMIQVLEK